jgi:hypothetical protein
MSNLSAAAPLRFKGEPKIEKFVVNTGVAQLIYRGAPLMLDDTGDTENIIVSSGITVATSDVFVGIAAENKIISTDMAERMDSSGLFVYVEPTIIGFKSTVFTANADLGKVVSMTDTATLVSGTGAAYPRIGKVFKIEDGYCYVQLETPWIQAGS